MKKSLTLLLVLALCLPLCACFGASEPLVNETTPLTVEELYSQLIEYAKNEQYQEAKWLYTRNGELKNYADADDYYQYCVIIDGYYSKGRLGYTYRELSKISSVLDTAAILSEIEQKIQHLEGEWVEDNGRGAYLYLAIKDGYLANEVVAYNDAEGFVYTDEDFLYEIVEHTYSDGTVGLAVSEDYSINYFEEDQTLMLIKFAEAEFNTFNGVYEKIK